MRRSAGFSLVEALVALVVISFGLLGVATMQLKALEGAHVGYRHSLVSLMAIDAQERVWSSLGIGCATNTDLSEINASWVEYWFDTANLGFSNHASEITVEPIEVTLAPNEITVNLHCQYRVRVSWEELPYSINEVDQENVDGENGNGEVKQERIKEFEYLFRVPSL